MTAGCTQLLGLAGHAGQPVALVMCASAPSSTAYSMQGCLELVCWALLCQARQSSRALTCQATHITLDHPLQGHLGRNTQHGKLDGHVNIHIDYANEEQGTAGLTADGMCPVRFFDRRSRGISASR